uniref:Sperm flagellar 2 n=2 Tax=Iconisemion striatum TaxID=60296 RepID=A0A1A7X812_9TELE
MRGYKRTFGCSELKQELVSLRQTDFTNIADDIRGDEDIKAEEHLRLNELLEQLQVIDDHEYENESKMIKLSSEKCLEAHTALLISYHSELMQVELSHFWESISFLRVYYWSKHRLVPLKSMSKCHFLLESSEKKDRPCGYSHGSRSSSRADPVEPSCKELFSVYEMAFEEISRLVSEENQQRETIKQEEKKTNKNESANAKQAKKGKGSAKIQTAKREDDSKMKHDQEMVEKIHKKYVNALSHEEKAAKIRIKLVADHGAVMIRFLQSRAQETLSTLKKSFQLNDRAESTDQLEEVVFHIIEAGAKLQYELSMHGPEEATELTMSEVSGDTPLTSSSIVMDQEASVSSLSQR